MRIAAAYICVILIWSTTPLAIKWSGEGPGFIFGAASRMVIGLACMLILLPILRRRLPFHKKAVQTYLAVALQIYAAMMAVYWAAQFIPSGWISVIFGLTPFITALLASAMLGERSLALNNLLAYTMGVCGLAVMFSSAIRLGHGAVMGIAGVLTASFLQSFSAVWVKRIQASLPAVTQVTGGLLFAVPVYSLTWYFADGQWPAKISPASLASIVYLGTIATTIGFALYYYVLTHMKATHVALITLVSPVMALLLGNRINHEPLTVRVGFGTLLILSALIIHTFFDRLKSNRQKKTQS